MNRYIKKIKQKYKETKERELLIYLILRTLVIICMIQQILRGDINEAAEKVFYFLKGKKWKN